MDVFDLYATISIRTNEFEQGLEKAQKKFSSFAKNLSGLSSSVDKAYSGVKDALQPAVDGFKAVEGVGKKAGNAVVSGLKGFAAASTAVAGFGTAAVKSGMAFDSTMSQVSAISGATGQDFQDLRDKALEMGAKTKFSASEAAEAMTYMGMAGWKAGDMISGIEGIMNLAAASGEDLATTSDIVTDALTAFGLQASDSGHFADVMAVAASNANTNVGMMGETFKYVAPVAGALGYSVDDTALAIGLMANSGIKATQAGTSLRSIFTRLSTDAGASSKKLGALGVLTKELGVQFYNTDGSAHELNDVLNDSRAVWAGLSEEQQITYAKTIAGQEAMSGWLALMNAAPADVEKLTNALEDCNGAAKEMAATMVDNLQGGLTLLGSAFESLQIAISDSLTPALREFAQFGQKAMGNLLEGFQGNGVSGFMSALTGIVTDGVTMLAQKAPEFASVSLQFVQALADGLLNAADTLIVTGYDVVFDVIKGIKSWISENSDRIIEIGKDLVFYVLNGFLGATEIISENIGKFIPLLVDGFTAYHEALFTAGAEIIGQLVAGIATAGPEVQAIIGVAVLPHILKIVDTVGKIGGAVTSVVKVAGDGINFITDIGSKLMGGIKALFALVTSGPIGIAAAIAGIIAAVVLLYNKCEWFRDGVNAVIDAVVGFFQNAWEAVQAAWQSAGEFFGGIVDSVKGAFDGIGEFLGGLFEAAWEAVSGAWDAAVDFFSGIGDGIHEAFETVTSFLGDAFSSAWDVVSGAWDAAVSFFSDIWDGIKTAAGETADKIGKSLSDAWDAVCKAWEGAKDFFGGVVEGIVGAFSNIGGKFLEIGGNIVNGIKDGIGNAWNSFIGWLGSKVNGIVDAVKGMLGIHSPSKVFAGIGENMALGLAEGWDDEYNAIKRKIEGGMNFGTASVGLVANGTSYNAPRTAQNGPQTGFGGAGNTYVTINSPIAVDAVQAAREWKKTTQHMAMAY